MRLTVNVLTRVFLTLCFVSLNCPEAMAGERGMHLAVGMMAFMNSTSQGGQGTEGSTVLTQSELFYHGPWWGIGTFFQYDKQGSNETDTAFGPKLELHAGPFYVEGGYAPLMQRAFTDRSIEKQTGNAWLLGVGTRFMLGTTGGAGKGGIFLQFSYKYRIQNIIKQDNVPISEKIIQKDGYPLFGIGLLF